MLHWAASAGALTAIDYSLEQGALVDKLDHEGRSPLHIAALSGHTEAVERLLQRRADPEARDASGASPLHRAALAGSAGCVALLARAAPGLVDLKQQRTDGTALHAAVTGLRTWSDAVARRPIWAMCASSRTVWVA